MRIKDPQPTLEQKRWMELGYGMFIHFGPNTLEGKAWGEGTFPAEEFIFSGLNVDQWAEVAAEAGMKYAILTAKHHDGFCLWPSKYTEYSVKNSPVDEDIVGSFVRAFRKAGVKTGLYYSLWDKNFAGYEKDDLYFAYMKNQLTELLTQYGEILELWFDGGWDKDYPDRTWEAHRTMTSEVKEQLGKRWRWSEIYQLIHGIQPQCLVVNNSSSDCPGIVKYHPVDLRTSEHFNFIYQGKICFPELNPIVERGDGEKVYLPLEFCTSLNPDWFWTGRGQMLHPSVETICGWHRYARENGGNLLLNIGPNAEGVIPEYHRYYLKLAAKAMGLL